MKNLLKILSLIIVFVMASNSGYAIQIGKIEKLIKNSPLNETSTVAVSIKNVQTGKSVFELNEKKLLHPASVLKVFTLYSAIDTLGYDYFFKTGFYKDSANNLYIKLGADPTLTSAQLKNAFHTLKENGHNSFNNLYFDDSIADKKEFSQGWMWDDDINPYTPKVSSYNLDGNIIKVRLDKNSQGFLTATVKGSYPMSVITYIKANADKNSLDANRYNWNNPEVVEIEGSLKSPGDINIPVSSMRRYFIFNTEKALEDTGIKISATRFSSKSVPADAELITEISNPVTAVIPSILQNSNNLAAESVFKIAAGKKYGITGSDDAALNMFKEFYKNIDISADELIVKDGCGISRYNLINADWISRALANMYKQNDFEKFKEQMAQPGDGTLSTRLFDLRGDVYLKTGTLSNISTIAGYITSQDGNTYAFAMLTQNFTHPVKNIKAFEDEIIKLIYSP